MRGKLSKYVVSLGALSAVCLVSSNEAMAQHTPPEPPLPSYRNIDQHGVDLGWVAFKEIETHSSIGALGHNALSRHFYSLMDNPQNEEWGDKTQIRDNYFGIFYVELLEDRVNYIVKFGDKVEYFNISSHNGGYLFSSDHKNYTGQTFISLDGGERYKYTSSDGTEIIFEHEYFRIAANNINFRNGMSTWGELAYPTYIKRPSGEKIKIHYKDNFLYCQSNSGVGGTCISGFQPRILAVSSNFGYLLKYEYDGSGNLSRVAAINASENYYNPNTEGQQSFSHWQIWNYQTPSSVRPWWRNSIDPLGRSKYFSPQNITMPSGSYKRLQMASTPGGLTYHVPNNGPVDFWYITPSGSWKYGRQFATVQMGGAPDPVSPSIYYIGTDPYTIVTDPLGGQTRYDFSKPNEGTIVVPWLHPNNYNTPFTVGYDVIFSSLHKISNPVGNSVTYYYASIPTGTFDSTGNEGRYLSDVHIGKAIYKEGNEVDYEYDVRTNLKKKTFRSKDGASTIVIEYGYPTTCASTITCNKPTWIKDANGKQWDYTYDSIHGGILTETGPADANGVRPQTRFTYSPLYAKIKNSSGALVNAEGPIYLLTRKSSCTAATSGNPASCVGTANESVTLYEYAHNNLLLTSETTAAGNANLTQPSSSTNIYSKISYTYDVYGNTVMVDGPRTDVDDRVYKTYDMLRRPIFEIGADPDGGGALKRPTVKHYYDVDGLETRTETGTCGTVTMSGGIPTGCSDFVWTSAKKMTYDGAGRLTKTEVVQP